MTNDVKGQTLALAAIFQFASAVEKLAKTGQITNSELKTAVNSLFVQNPQTTLDVYGDLGQLESGLKSLIESLQRKPERSSDCVRYVMGILHLERRLAKRQDMLSVIGSRLDKNRHQLEHFSAEHENVVAGLAEIYSDTISSFSFRIQVMGEYQHLQQARIANQIRTLLFAGIRSAVLWRQLGGRRLAIIINRSKFIKIAEQLLADSQQQALH